MALINCPECGRQVSDQAATCPECAHPLKTVPDSGPVRHVPPVIQKKGRGCFSWIGIGAAVIVGIGIIALIITPRTSQPSTTVSGTAGPKAAATALPTVGQTASLGGWEVTLLDFGPYERFDQSKAPTAAQGKRVVADMRIKNLQTSTSNFTQSDFELKAADGRTFKPDSVTASIQRGFMISQQVQPGLTTENRVVFDIAPTAQGLTFTALKMVFSVPNQ